MSHDPIYYCGLSDCDDAFCSHNSWVREAPLFYGINDTECPLKYLVELLKYAKHFHASQKEFFTLILCFSSRGDFHQWLRSSTKGFISSTDFVRQFLRKYSQLCNECIRDERNKLDYLEDLASRYLTISQNVEHEGIFWSNSAFETEPPLTGLGSEDENEITFIPPSDDVEVSNVECTEGKSDTEVFDFSWLYDIPENQATIVVNYAFIPEFENRLSFVHARSNAKLKKFLPCASGKLENHQDRLKAKPRLVGSSAFTFEHSKFAQKSIFDFRLIHMPFECG